MGLDPVCLHPVVKHLHPIIEQNRGNKRLSGFLFLLFQHGIEASDGVGLQPLHGAAAVQNEYQLGQILLHK